MVARPRRHCRTVLVALALALGAAAPQAPAFAQAVTPQVRIVSGDGQSALLNEQFARPFVVRVTDAQDAPLAGATIHFTVNVCLDLIVRCAPDGYFGHWAGTSLEGGSATATVDASGLAVSPGFVAGSVPSSYEIFVYVPSQQLGGRAIASALPPLRFRVTQFAAVAVPAADGVTLAALALAVLLAGITTARRAARGG